MVLGKRWSTPSYLKKNLSGKTISTSSYQQAKQVSTVFFPLSETNVVVDPWIFPNTVNNTGSPDYPQPAHVWGQMAQDQNGPVSYTPPLFFAVFNDEIKDG